MPYQTMLIQFMLCTPWNYRIKFLCSCVTQGVPNKKHNCISVGNNKQQNIKLMKRNHNIKSFILLSEINVSAKYKQRTILRRDSSTRLSSINRAAAGRSISSGDGPRGLGDDLSAALFVPSPLGGFRLDAPRVLLRLLNRRMESRRDFANDFRL